MQHGALSSGHAVQADRRLRRGQQPDRRCISGCPGSRSCSALRPEALVNGRDPAAFQGLDAERRSRDRLHGAEPAGRPCDAQPARPARLLARRQHQPERHLSRMLHGRAGACGRPGPARVPAQADGEASEAPCGAQRGGRQDRLGQAGAAGRLSRHRAADGLSAAMSRPPPKSRSPTATRSRCIASSPPPIPATPSIRRRSSGRSRARSSTACRRCSMAAAR